MSITNRFLADVAEYQVILSGKFDFSQLTEFRDAYENAPDNAKKFAIDMRAVEMIDSSALGMLLKMKRSLGLADGEIVITNCSNDVEKILKIAKFDLIFAIQ